MYSIKLIAPGNIEYKAKGESIAEALLKIDLKKILGKSKLVVTKGKNSYDFILVPPILKRLYYNKVYQQIFQKRADLFLQ